MASPAFTVIIPSYNAREKLPAAIDSVLQQSFINWELLIMDGRSTDGTVDMIRQYAEKDQRIRFVSEKDKGIYDAMNKGIDLAKGEWLYFMGSDDTLYGPDVLQRVSKVIAADNYQAIYANVFGAHFDRIYDGEFENGKLYRQNICHQAIFLHRSVYELVGKFDLRYRSHADWAHNIKWFYNSQVRKVYIDEVIAYYAAGGYSSVNVDHDFAKDKDFIFLEHGGKLIDKVTKTRVYLSIAIKKKQEKSYASFWFYKLKFWLTKYA
jgi:glycosyltransferase involved in cell wall biosynthesis